MKNLAKRIPTIKNMLIPDWLINPTPNEKVDLLRFCIVVDFNHLDYYFKRYEEIPYEVMEQDGMVYYP